MKTESPFAPPKSNDLGPLRWTTNGILIHIGCALQAIAIGINVFISSHRSTGKHTTGSIWLAILVLAVLSLSLFGQMRRSVISWALLTTYWLLLVFYAFKFHTRVNFTGYLIIVFGIWGSSTVLGGLIGLWREKRSKSAMESEESVLFDDSISIESLE